MADFRKWLIVLAVLAAVAVPASAQTFSCVETGVNAKIRGEGLTELVGDIIITCSGGVANTAIAASVTVSFSQNVTSKLVAGPTGCGSLCTESLLLVDDNTGSGTVVPVQGSINSVFPNELQFGPVTLTEPGNTPTGTQRTIRITNVRLIGGNPSTQTELFGIIAGNIGSFSIPSPTVFVAQSQPSLTVKATASPSTVKTCTGGESTIVLKYSGSIPNTFKAYGPGYTTPGLPSTPGFTPTESGLIQGGAGIPATAGTASQGTRLYATFSNIPAGVTLTIPAAGAGGSDDATALLVGTDTSAGGTGVAPVGIASFTITGPGSGTAVWEITGSDNVFTPIINFDITAAIPLGSPAPSTFMSVVAGYAPFPTAAAAAAWAAPSATLPLPRFIPVTQETDNLLQVVPCVTNLLFPYVVNVASMGWDTGIALANTSNDDAIFATPTTPQKGTCTEYYFGFNAPATPPVTPVIDSTSIVAGGAVYAFDVSSVAPEFYGYLIVRCNFQYGHGFAFITGLGAGGGEFAEGYLALVIPDRSDTTRPADPFSTAGTASGETLGE